MLQVVGNDKYSKAIEKITQEQGKIVGEEIAVEMASTIEGININQDKMEIITNNPKLTLEKLVEQFSTLFGLVSIQVSKDALKSIEINFTQEELPEILKS
jgi:F0F1-type ATP synthase delta subunit